MSAEPVICAEALTKSYGSFLALRGIDLEVRVVVDREFVAVSFELPAGRWRTDDSNAPDGLVEFLVHMSENGSADLAVLADQVKKCIGVFQPHTVQPFTADGQRWVMQAYKHMTFPVFIKDTA